MDKNTTIFVAPSNQPAIDKELTFKMKEVINIARQKNKILPIATAFETHSVDEEEHKGKIDYWKKDCISCQQPSSKDSGFLA